MAAAVRLHRKRGRSASGATLLEGPNLLAEAIAGGASIAMVFGLPDDHRSQEAAAGCGAEWVPVTAAVLRKLATTPEPQSPVAVVAIPDVAVPAGGDLLVAWGVSDPGNTGTLIRTAAAFGMGFVAGPDTADLWSPKVLRSAAGGHWRTPIGVALGLEALRGADRVLVATVVADGDSPGVLRELRRAALLIGGEAHGLPAEIAAAADVRITIPMPGGTESLNAAMAGAILAYELSGGASGAPSTRD
ncbi:MAG: RNA methyltransferase [Actinobacteria bacterium]|nr:RNA methyltransferase [Actinomycetota bacterium]